MLKSEDFQESLRKLKEYVKQKHNTKVPFGYTDESGFGLGGWVSHRRTAYKKGELSSDHIQQLEEVKGWVWDVKEEDFQEGLKKLKEYVKQKHNAAQRVQKWTIVIGSHSTIRIC